MLAFWDRRCTAETSPSDTSNFKMHVEEAGHLSMKEGTWHKNIVRTNIIPSMQTILEREGRHLQTNLFLGEEV